MPVLRASFGILSRLPRWFLKGYSLPLVAHEKALEHFTLAEDINRFACGWAWTCKRCGSVCCAREELADEYGAWIVTSIFCRECWASFRVDNLEPMWVRVLEDWESASPVRETASDGAHGA